MATTKGVERDGCKPDGLMLSKKHLDLAYGLLQREGFSEMR